MPATDANDTPDPRAEKALQLHLAGVDWITIGDRLDYPDPSDAYEAAADAASVLYDGPPAEPARIFEVLRLNRLQAAIWPAAMRGDTAAVDRALNIGDRRVRLMRLNQRSEAS